MWTVNDVLSQSIPLEEKGMDQLNSNDMDWLNFKGVDQLKTSLTVHHYEKKLIKNITPTDILQIYTSI